MPEQEETNILAARQNIQDAQAQALAAQQQAQQQQQAMQTQQQLRSGGLQNFQQRQVQQQNINSIQNYQQQVNDQANELDTYLKTPAGIKQSSIDAGNVMTSTNNITKGSTNESGLLVQNYPETTTTYTSPFGFGTTTEKSGGVPQYQTIAIDKTIGNPISNNNNVIGIPSTPSGTQGFSTPSGIIFQPIPKTPTYTPLNQIEIPSTNEPIETITTIPIPRNIQVNPMSTVPPNVPDYFKPNITPIPINNKPIPADSSITGTYLRAVNLGYNAIGNIPTTPVERSIIKNTAIQQVQPFINGVGLLKGFTEEYSQPTVDFLKGFAKQEVQPYITGFETTKQIAGTTTNAIQPYVSPAINVLGLVAQQQVQPYINGGELVYGITKASTPFVNNTIKYGIQPYVNDINLVNNITGTTSKIIQPTISPAINVLGLAARNQVQPYITGAGLLNGAVQEYTKPAINVLGLAARNQVQPYINSENLIYNTAKVSTPFVSNVAQLEFKKETQPYITGFETAKELAQKYNQPVINLFKNVAQQQVQPYINGGELVYGITKRITPTVGEIANTELQQSVQPFITGGKLINQATKTTTNAIQPYVSPAINVLGLTARNQVQPIITGTGLLKGFTEKYSQPTFDFLKPIIEPDINTGKLIIGISQSTATRVKPIFESNDKSGIIKVNQLIPGYEYQNPEIAKPLVQSLDLLIKGSFFSPYMTTATAKKGGQQQETTQEEKTSEEQGGEKPPVKPEKVGPTVGDIKKSIDENPEGYNKAIEQLKTVTNDADLKATYQRALESKNQEQISLVEKVIRDMVGDNNAERFIFQPTKSFLTEQEDAATNRFFVPGNNLYASTAPTGKIDTSLIPQGQIPIQPPLETRFGSNILGVPPTLKNLAAIMAAIGPVATLFKKPITTNEKKSSSLEFPSSSANFDSSGSSNNILNPSASSSNSSSSSDQTSSQKSGQDQSQPSSFSQGQPSTPTSGQPSIQIQPPIIIPAIIPAITQPQIQVPVTTQVPAFDIPSLSLNKFASGNIPFGFNQQTIQKQYKKKLISKRNAYNVLIKRKGKFFQIAQGLPLGRAEQVGANKAISTLARTFQLQPAGETNLDDINYTVSPSLFRAPKRPTNNPLTFVQRVGINRGTGEVGEIQSFKRRANISKPLFKSKRTNKIKLFK